MNSRSYIVLLVLDTHRLDRLSCYGNHVETMPNLDIFASEATLFRHAMSTAQWTVPSHSSMFTGLYPTDHAMFHASSVLPASFLFLLYLIWYPLGRFFIEFLRTDSWFFPGTPFNVIHLLSAIAIIYATTILFIRHRGESLTKEEDNNSGMDVETTEAPASSQEM